MSTQSKSLCFHDEIASGRLYEALSQSTSSSVEISSDVSTQCKMGKEEILRLPLLLRLLSNSQHLVDGSSITTIESSDTTEPIQEEHAMQIVQLLEQLATRHSSAETIERFSHIILGICRPVSKYLSTSLKRKRRLVAVSTENGEEIIYGKGTIAKINCSDNKLHFLATTGWNGYLETILGHRKKDSSSNNLGTEGEQYEDDTDDEGPDNKISLQHENDGDSKKRKRDAPISILESASLDELDSLDATICKILIELIDIVVSSLKPFEIETMTKELNANILLNAKEDSILSECAVDGKFDLLSATVTALMQYLPIVRHEHVANALCRASIPQCTEIIQRLAANNINSTGALVRGCINAYKTAEACILCASEKQNESEKLSIVEQHRAMVKTSKDAVEAIASLSHREAMHVISSLQQSEVMEDIILNIMIANDDDNAVAFLRKELQKYYLERNEESKGETHLFIAKSDTWFGATRSKSFIIRQWASSHSTDTTSINKWISFLFHYILTSVAEQRHHMKITLALQTLGLVIAAFGCQHDEKIQHSLKTSCDYLISLVCKESEGHFDRFDSFAKSLFSTAVLICSNLLDQDKKFGTEFEATLQNLYKLQSSMGLKVFFLQVNFFLSSRDYMNGFLQFSISTILETLEFPCIDPRNHSSLDSMDTLYEWLGSLLLEKTPTVERSFLLEADSLLKVRKFVTIPGSKLSSHLSQILQDPKQCLLLSNKKSTISLIEANVETANIPIILPVTLQANCKKYFGQSIRSQNINSFRQLQLSLLYALFFAIKHPRSPFASNFRLLPIRSILEEQFVLDDKHVAVSEALLTFVQSHCPEILNEMDRISKVQDDVNIPLEPRELTPPKISQKIKQYLTGMSIIDENMIGMEIERMFFASRSIFQSADVDAEVCDALLSSVDDSFYYKSYSGMCKDPLLLLKCSLKVWINAPLRRILINILERLLSANEAMIIESSLGIHLKSESITSRDAVIVRCFLFLLSGCYEGIDPISCPKMVSILRSLFARGEGLIAAIIRQGLPFVALDWLISNVPEIYQVEPLSDILDGRGNSLTIVEKLQISDGALRICVMYSDNEEKSLNLIYKTLSILVNSFFIILGPTSELPVSSLSDEAGNDITNKCQKILFRMLNVIQEIDSSNERLKHEVALSLSKIASFCKSDGSITNKSAKRKKLLSDVWNTVMKASTNHVELS